jgi:hypothetical protein
LAIYAADCPHRGRVPHFEGYWNPALPPLRKFRIDCPDGISIQRIRHPGGMSRAEAHQALLCY